MFEQLRTTDDGLEWRFQLMGNMSREFTTTTLILGLFRYIKGQQNKTFRALLPADAGNIELELSPVTHHPALAVTMLLRFKYRILKLAAPVNKQDVTPQKVSFYTEKSLCRRVDAQD